MGEKQRYFLGCGCGWYLMSSIAMPMIEMIFIARKRINSIKRIAYRMEKTIFMLYLLKVGNKKPQCGCIVV